MWMKLKGLIVFINRCLWETWLIIYPDSRVSGKKLNALRHWPTVKQSKTCAYTSTKRMYHTTPKKLAKMKSHTLRGGGWRSTMTKNTCPNTKTQP